MRVRVWWYLRTKRHPPRDVREYIIRECCKAAADPMKTPEEQQKFATELLTEALFSGDQEMSQELRDEVIKIGFRFIGEPKPLPMPPKQRGPQ